MMKDAAESMDVAPMTIVSGSHIQNAETDGSTLFYNEEFMSSLAVSAGEDGVRFVVAHELGHQLHGMGNSGHEAEYMADEYAAQHLAQIGGGVGGTPPATPRPRPTRTRRTRRRARAPPARTTCSARSGRTSPRT